MDKGTGVGWRSALMAPVCFVIRSSVKRRSGRNGGGRTVGKEKRADTERKTGKRTDIQTDRIKPVYERGRKRIQRLGAN